MIAISYTKTDGINVFSDALNLADDHTFTIDEIEAMKQAAYEQWLSVIYSANESVAEVVPESVTEVVSDGY